MRIMITGGTGFVGYHTALALIDQGHEISLLVRSADKARALYGERTPDLTVGDIIDRQSVASALRGCDGVVHCAAMVSTDAVDAEKVYNTNVDGTKIVIEEALAQQLESIIHVSSVTALFDPSLSVLDGDCPPGVAKNAYGRSKVSCEKFVRQLQEEGAPIHITYPASVVGPDDPGLTEPHIGLQTYLTMFVPKMPGGMQFVDVRDVAEVHSRLLQADLPPQRLTLGGHYVNWKELGLVLDELTGRKLIRLPLTGLLARSMGTAIDIAKRYVKIDEPVGHEAMVYATQWVPMDNAQAEETLDFEFRPLPETLGETVHWLRVAGHITNKHAGKKAHSA